MERLIIVGCGAAKLAHPAPAKDLYTSQLSKAKRAYAESSGSRWLIASAYYGLMSPRRKIEPYDMNLGDADQAYRGLWMRLVTEQFNRLAWTQIRHVELHAGKLYRGMLSAAISRADKPLVEFTHPTEGMGIGQQLGWYKAQRNV